MRALTAGAAYFALVFGLGFLLGALRQLLTGAGLSRGMLVAAEIPVMLVFAWWAAGRCAERFGVAISAAARLTMGAVMFALLRLGELATGVALMGQTVQDHAVALATTAGLLETAPQLLTALFPLIRARLTAR
jgi:hypothetical protein